MVRDRATGKYHGFFDVGCYTPDSVMHVDGFQLPHVVGDSPMGPFAVKEIAAPPTHFNPHALHFDDGTAAGIYVLYTNGGGFRAAGGGAGDAAEGRSAAAAAAPAGSGSGSVGAGGRRLQPPASTRCNGGESDGRHTTAPFTHPKGDCNSSLCAIYAKSLDGPWSMTNVQSVCTNNFGPWHRLPLPFPFVALAAGRLLSASRRFPC